MDRPGVLKSEGAQDGLDVRSLMQLDRLCTPITIELNPEYHLWLLRDGDLEHRLEALNGQLETGFIASTWPIIHMSG